MSLTERAQERRARYEYRGLLFGFIVTLALSAYIVSLGFAWQSVGVVIGSIAGTAGTFIYSNRARRQVLSARRQAPPTLPELPDGSKESS